MLPVVSNPPVAEADIIIVSDVSLVVSLTGASVICAVVPPDTIVVVEDVRL